MLLRSIFKFTEQQNRGGAQGTEAPFSFHSSEQLSYKSGYEQPA
jgi:hypothetical protein